MKAKAIARPNIALIKYWGKRDVGQNLPAVGSISITLRDLYTSMCVDFSASSSEDELTVNGAQDSAMLPRLSSCLDTVAGADRPRAKIESQSNFPIAAGLASSASSFAALVVAASGALQRSLDGVSLARLAGQASGSAARSLFSGFVELRNAGDEIDVYSLRNSEDWPLSVVIAITETGAKPIGSTAAMEISRKTSPFYNVWVDQQEGDLAAARTAIAERDFEKLARVSEHSCLKMHSVMWASRPAMVYWNAATVACMETVRELQRQRHGVFFTIDAGPQVKAVCLPDEAVGVATALAGTPGVVKVMTTGLGDGAALEPSRI